MAQNGCTTRLVINLTPSQKKCSIEPPNMASALKTGNKFCFWLFLDPKMMETYMETINQLSQFNPIVKSRLLISDFVDTSRSWLFDVICSATFTKQSPFLLTKKMMSTLKQFLRPDHDGTVRQVCSNEIGYHCD
jgi:hypothetical protein